MTPLVHIYGESHVAAVYGLEEAIFLHSLMFWYRTNRGNGQNFHDGRWWTYNSVKAFEGIFPWWNSGQIRRIIARCKEKGALLAGNYNEDQRDRTAWYTPSDELLELYGEIENCICRKQQMEMPESSETFDENGKCNIRNTWGNHGETDMTPCSPPDSPADCLPGDAPSADSKPVDKPASKPKRSRKSKYNPTHDPEAFEIIWGIYPRKDGRDKAVKKWDEIKPDRELCRVMYKAIKRQCKSEQWARDEGKYIPMLSTWLHGGRWKDQGVDLSLLQASQPRNTSGWAEDPEVPS